MHIINDILMQAITVKYDVVFIYTILAYYYSL